MLQRHHKDICNDIEQHDRHHSIVHEQILNRTRKVGRDIQTEKSPNKREWWSGGKPRKRENGISEAAGEAESWTSPRFTREFPGPRHLPRPFSFRIAVTEQRREVTPGMRADKAAEVG
ncbi:hypothetical protein KM043_011543 [Ampulex compressa]|nr:hypothetical protein KM043_011543 [Ampulex compressa]